MYKLISLRFLSDRDFLPTTMDPQLGRPCYNASETTIFTIAGFFTILLSSILCIADLQNWTPKTIVPLKLLWAFCAAGFALCEKHSNHNLYNSGIDPQAAATALAMLYLLAKAWQHLRSIPATFLAKRTILWKLWHIWRGTYITKIRKLHAQHGDVVQVGPREYSVSNPAYFGRCSELDQVGAESPKCCSRS
jgi:hypothetical protein